LRQIIEYDLIVIDTPPALRSQLLTAVIAESDYLILPTPPAPMDLMALIDTVRTAVKPLGIAYRVLLTKVDSRSLKETLEAQNTLLELGIPACHAFVRNYKAQRKSRFRRGSYYQLAAVKMPKKPAPIIVVWPKN
jgi:chromosome partitioning protein